MHTNPWLCSYQRVVRFKKNSNFLLGFCHNNVNPTSVLARLAANDVPHTMQPRNFPAVVMTAVTFAAAFARAAGGITWIRVPLETGGVVSAACPSPLLQSSGATANVNATATATVVSCR